MSREAELYKDKIEVSLDGRQIFYLFFGGSVIVGLVFVLGVMVGRRIEARGHTDRARVAATVDPLAALDRLEGGGGLSFQGALRGAEGPVSDVEKKIAALPKRDGNTDSRSDDPKLATKIDGKPAGHDLDQQKSDTAQPGDKKTGQVADKKVDKAEDKKGDKAAAKVVDKAESNKADKADEHKADKAEDKKADKPDDHKAAKAEDKKADKADDHKAAKAEDKKAEGKDDKKAEGNDKKTEGKDDKKPRYTLQLSSFQDRAEAQAYLDAIKGAGYQAYMTEGAVDGKQYFRVRLGSYKSMEAANEAKAELEKSAKKTAIVIKL